MARYLISFPDGAMAHITDEDLPAVGEAAHAVLFEAKAAGVWVHGGGILHDVETSVVAPDGSVIDGADDGPPMGGFSIVDVPSREEALAWAAKTAAACRCAQEVRELMPDPDA
jgi:hypothetical protein